MFFAAAGCYEKIGDVELAIQCCRRALSNEDKEGLANSYLAKVAMNGT